MAVAVGRRAARVAQRVRRDEPRPARRGLRPPRRRQDLRFPHHENERAQAVALGKRFANHWMHHGFVVDAEGEKMSKSLGNVDNLLDLLDRYDGRAYRMLLLQSHYRSPVRVGADSLQAAETRSAGLDAFAARSAAVGDGGRRRRRRARRVPGGDGRRPRHARRRWRVLFDTVRRANAALDAGDADGRPLVAAVVEIAGAVGLELGARRRGAGRRRSRGPRRSTRPGRPRTTPPPTPSAPSCRPTAGSSRRRRPARPCADDDGVGRRIATLDTPADAPPAPRRSTAPDRRRRRPGRPLAGRGPAAGPTVTPRSTAPRPTTTDRPRPPVAAARPPPAGAVSGYQPGLDGLRALSVIA